METENKTVLKNGIRVHTKTLGHPKVHFHTFHWFLVSPQILGSRRRRQCNLIWRNFRIWQNFENIWQLFLDLI